MIGYPDWWGTGRGNGKASNKGRVATSGVRSKGASGLAHEVKAIRRSSSQFEASSGLTNHDRATLAPVLTDEQWGTLLNMFKQCTAKSTSSKKLSSKCSSISS